MAAELKISSVGIVLLGPFAPTIFHPTWFARNKLIAEEEAADAKIDVVHADVTNFKTEWLTLSVTKDRFSALCTRDDATPLLRDLTVSICQLFPALPISAFGINKHFHFQMSSEDAWHDLGHKLAPKAPWNALLQSPGMQSVQMTGQRMDKYRGKINVTVQPSGQLKLGSYVQVNDHYDLAVDAVPALAADACTIIREVWQDSLDRSEKIADGLVLK